MTLILAYLIGLVAYALICGLAYLVEKTAIGRALVAYALVRILGDRRQTPREEEPCCVTAKADRVPALYYLHRVRVHGEGQV